MKVQNPKLVQQFYSLVTYGRTHPKTDYYQSVTSLLLEMKNVVRIRRLVKRMHRNRKVTTWDRSLLSGVPVKIQKVLKFLG